MGTNDLVIRISGDIGDFKEKLRGVSKQTEDLSDQLATIGKTAGLAFAGLTGTIAGSIAAFREQEAAVNKLDAALRNNGIYTKELSAAYVEQAAALQQKTIYGDEEIINAQAQLQMYTGQKQVTKELTGAVLDLASAKGIDLQSAADLVGKTIGTTTNALMRQGIQIADNIKGDERLAAVISGINGLMGGQAEAAAKGAGAFLQLKNAVSDIFEAIGEQLVPILAPAARYLTDLATAVSKNKEFAEMAAKVLLTGAALTGLITVAASAGLGLLYLRSAFIAAGGAASVMSLGVKALVGATGLGLLAILLTDIAVNWQTRWAQMQAIFQAFVDNISSLGLGLGNILKGVFTFDTALIREGIEQAKAAMRQGFADFSEIRAEQRTIAAEEEIVENETKRQRVIDAQTAEHERKMATIKAEALNEKTLKFKVEEDKAKDQIAANNKYLIEQQKYGTAYATINKVTDEIVTKERKQALNDLAVMQTSSNSTLKAIGKAAAIANIIIKTKEAAMNIYAGFSAIPFVGQALGIAGAAAAIAFGAEQISGVVGAADGGLITGGIAGMDSVPAMLMPGELVAPTNNFDEVIGSVRAMREAESRGLMPGSGGGDGGGYAQIEIILKDQLGDLIEAKLIERERLGISFRGVS